MVQPSGIQLEIMKIIWANNNVALFAEIIAGLEKDGEIWQKNTVTTMLSRLVEKGLLKTCKIGRRNEYTAIFSEADYRASQTKTFVNRLFEGKAKGLVSTLIEKEMLTKDDYEEIVNYWKGVSK